MKLSSFDLDLPPQYIAKYPPKKRGNARLMVVHRNTGKIEHLKFDDIVDLFEEGDALVLNNSKVLPAKIIGCKEKTEAYIEVLLLRELNPKTSLWDTMINPARKIRIGNKIYFGDHMLTAEVVDNTTSRGRTVKFFFDNENYSLYDILEEIGIPPLPLILQRKAEPLDKERYQTIYAERRGSTLVPDGGLNFTPYILKKLALKGIETPSITLHKSINTLKTLVTQDLSRHTPISEYCEITQDATETINATLTRKKKIYATGVSILEALEFSSLSERNIRPIKNWISKFIYPPYEPYIVDGLLTNFHLPGTSSFINTVAFGGADLMMKAYRTAIKRKYKFFVYGDALLIL